jgi:hypothetical protein
MALVQLWLHACGDADRAAAVPVPRGVYKMTWESSWHPNATWGILTRFRGGIVEGWALAQRGTAVPPDGKQGAVSQACG